MTVSKDRFIELDDITFAVGYENTILRWGLLAVVLLANSPPCLTFKLSDFL